MLGSLFAGLVTPTESAGIGVLAAVIKGFALGGPTPRGLWQALMTMTLPIVLPLLVGLGNDPVWLGIIITLLIEIGMLTPPVGMNIFVVIGMTNGQVKLGEGAMVALPYWLVLLVLIGVLTAFPELALWLPALVGS